MARILILSSESFAPLVAILAEAGHQVVEAVDSGHVLQLVTRRNLDAVILPENPEPLEGEELLYLVRRLTRAIIIVAGQWGDETRGAATLLQGADAFLRYPDDPDRLRSRVRAALRRTGQRTTETPRRGDGGTEADGKGNTTRRIMRLMAVA